MTRSLRDAIAQHDNDYRPHVERFECRTGLCWHDPTPPTLGRGSRLSIVIPVRDNAYCLPTVLDALNAARDYTPASTQLIVVDDASTDQTTAIIRDHPAVDIGIRLPRPVGGAAARNAGLLLAEAPTVLHMDGDMVLPAHALADVAIRGADDLVLVGFRHNVPYTPGPDGRPILPAGEPDLHADYRAHWTPPAGKPMFYSGQVYDQAFVANPLADTDDFVKLGHGRAYYDWDLPRMAVTALVATPRDALIDVGGFDPGFTEIGWGAEDTHMGAMLIAAGCKLAPLRQLRGHHIDPPDADEQWQHKLASAPPRLAHYRQLLTQPAPTGRRGEFTTRTRRLLAEGEALR
ncbi:glycosyltransferase family 2 protein [Actinocatenispora comari]|uniref:Glycosyl transferase family 2 n=1 Tax=Actinocatenispora comari TaxID=2807577 RepID=A0A8J4AGC6_9ACTN|nr:glycosyltransferase family 2 protein [Actinocatenispora comari]GIL29060.1 hypothetical protein NUM_43140 [Actinocatenispora comari]